MRRELVCLGAATPAKLAVREVATPEPRAGELRVRVEATAVNPIDAKRAGGYGRRLLALKGAARFPLVLGNDFAGTVEAAGTGVTGFVAGQRVYGLLGTGRGGGAHASQVVVPQAQLRAAPEGIDAASLAVLPYSFTTMWLALRGAGLTRANAAGRRVLVLGAAGGLGRLALPLLADWGAEVTAIASACNADTCRALGAHAVVERGPTAIASLPAHFDAVLNFAAWDDDAALASRLGPTALGHATTVHPLLGHFDRLGWWRGALACRRDFGALRAAVRARAPSARYAWTVFRPDAGALTALDAGLRAGRFALPVGIEAPFEQASAAFEHVAAGRPGRAVLRP
jgi:NADPH:quinone reductase-like Zn-dependent oxidoreductase